MAAAAANDAKSPVGKGRVFAADIDVKQGAASAELRHAVARFAAPALEKLAARHRTARQYS
jgi:hypothetical protein